MAFSSQCTCWETGGSSSSALNSKELMGLRRPMQTEARGVSLTWHCSIFSWSTRLPKGKYLKGTVWLKTDLILDLSSHATLLSIYILKKTTVKCRNVVIWRNSPWSICWWNSVQQNRRVGGRVGSMTCSVGQPPRCPQTPHKCQGGWLDKSNQYYETTT